MTYMFPSMYRGGDDDHAHTEQRVTFDAPPLPLKIGYWWLVVSAGLAIIFGLVVATSGYSGDTNVDPRLIAAVELNQRFVGVFNIVAGFLIAMLMTQVRRAVKYSRRWTLAVIVLCVLVDLIAFTVKAAGVGIALIPILLTTGALIIYRPIVNQYFAYQNDEY